MEFAYSSRVEERRAALVAFMDEHVYPAEPIYLAQVRAAGDPHLTPPVMEELKAQARRRGLWNLFMRDGRWGPGLTNLEYAPLAEIAGRSAIASEALNCSAPDTGNMEVLAEFGSPEHQERWLVPLLAGEIRSGFCMTEPEVASSDATNIRSRIESDGDELVLNGRKWWTTGAMNPRCRVLIFMGVTDPEAEPHRRQSLVLVPVDTPGVAIARSLPVFGYEWGGGGGDAEILFEDVRVPATNLLGTRGAGFALAQARLGPGRIHHCMRAIGMAERALDLMCTRALERIAFGKPLADQGVIQSWIAQSRVEIEQSRLLTLKAAWLMDTVGPRGARIEISAIKAVAPRMATNVVDRAIQCFGAAGVSDDFPLAWMYAHARTLHILDGPDEVHEMSIARRELRRVADARSGPGGRS